MPQSFALGLKDWRRRRGLSQMSLGLAADVSARHIAFLETGRANPTRTMVLRLAEALEVPRPERNALLEAAGFAAAYAGREISSADLESVRAALSWMLERHEPFPAFAIDRHWIVRMANRPAGVLLSSVGLAAGSSMLDAMTADTPLRKAIANWPEVARHMCARLRTESRHAGGDPVLDAAAARLAELGAEHDRERGLLPAVIPVRYRLGDITLSLFSTIAAFGSAEDIALAEMKIELLFPFDDETRHALEALAAR